MCLRVKKSRVLFKRIVRIIPETVHQLQIAEYNMYSIIWYEKQYYRSRQSDMISNLKILKIFGVWNFQIIYQEINPTLNIVHIRVDIISNRTLTFYRCQNQIRIYLLFSYRYLIQPAYFLCNTNYFYAHSYFFHELKIKLGRAVMKYD